MAIRNLCQYIRFCTAQLCSLMSNLPRRICSAASHAVNENETINSHNSVHSSEETTFHRGESHYDSEAQITHSRKRRRPDHDYFNSGHVGEILENETLSSLPPPPLLDAIVDVYFEKIHPWVPLLHEGRFRTRLEDHNERSKSGVVLHALVAITMKHVRFEDYDIRKSGALRQIRRSRNVVMLSAMDSLSVENLQALILIAFDHVSEMGLPPMLLLC
jgi:hypothetical protein